RLCCGAFGMLNTYDGQRWHRAADRGSPPAYAEYRRQNPRAVYGPSTAPGRLIAGEDVVHEVDLMAEGAYAQGEPNRRALVDLGGARSPLAVVLQKASALLGNIGISRQEVRPFSAKQIALLQNFAAQAVIAMESARLLTETREALEHQTATAEVMQVINSSPGDLAPVFDAILDKAHSLCGAEYGSLFTYDGERFCAAAARGEPRYTDRVRRRGPFSPDPGVPLDRVRQGEDVVEVVDLLEDEAIRRSPSFRELVEIGGYRSLLNIALRKDKALLRVLRIFRKETRPFSDTQSAVVP